MWPHLSHFLWRLDILKIIYLFHYVLYKNVDVTVKDRAHESTFQCSYQCECANVCKISLLYVSSIWVLSQIPRLKIIFECVTLSFPSLCCPVPSVYPRNVTVMLNESLLVIRWKDPPQDRVNGILTGYDVIVTYGTRVNKVSLLLEPGRHWCYHPRNMIVRMDVSILFLWRSLPLSITERGSGSPHGSQKVFYSIDSSMPLWDLE